MHERLLLFRCGPQTLHKYSIPQRRVIVTEQIPFWQDKRARQAEKLYHLTGLHPVSRTRKTRFFSSHCFRLCFAGGVSQRQTGSTAYLTRPKALLEPNSILLLPPSPEWASVWSLWSWPKWAIFRGLIPLTSCWLMPVCCLYLPVRPAQKLLPTHGKMRFAISAPYPLQYNQIHLPVGLDLRRLSLQEMGVGQALQRHHFPCR